MSDLDDLYQEVLLERAKSGASRGSLPQPCSCATAFNPLCGDEVSFYTRKANGRVELARHQGQGCAISQASASMAASACEGKTVEEARRELELAVALASGREAHPSLDDWQALSGVSRFPMRVKCATMPIRAALASLAAPDGSDREVEEEQP